MPIFIKVYGGTPPPENICLKCTKFRRIKGQVESQEIRMCAELKKRIPFEVTECSYYQQRDPNIRAFRNALNLEYDRKKKRLMIIEVTGPFERDNYRTIEQYNAWCDAEEAAARAEEETPEKSEEKTMAAGAAKEIVN